jgi:hypothetical protein
MSHRFSWWRVWPAVGLIVACGCAPLHLNKPSIWPFNDDKPRVPDKVVAIWADTVLYQPGEQPIRGFGGRLMFSEAKKEKPVKVDGALIVYAFEEDGRDPNNTKPDRKFVFTPDQLPAHYSKSQIGHSYSVWLPWDEVGGPQKEISLVVRFEPKGGTVVLGQEARQLLPGRTKETARGAAGQGGPMRAAGGEVQNAGGAYEPGVLPGAIPMSAAMQPGQSMVKLMSYEASLPPGSDPAGAQQQPARRMTTTTIPIPAGLAARPESTAPSATPAGAAVTSQGQSYPAQASPPQTLPGQASPGQPSPGPGLQNQTAPETQQRSRFSPPRSRVLGEPFARLTRDRDPWKPRPVGLPSGPGVPPALDPGSGLPASPSTAGPAPR